MATAVSMEGFTSSRSYSRSQIISQDMILTIRSWFNEPGVEFKVSHKVHQLVRSYLVECLMTPWGLEEKDPNVYLGLVIATSSLTTELEVRGPEYDKRNKFINYGLWLPFVKINNAEDYLREFLWYYFKALEIVFEKYSVPSDAIQGVRIKVEKEVLNNDTYLYVE